MNLIPNTTTCMLLFSHTMMASKQHCYILTLLFTHFLKTTLLLEQFSVLFCFFFFVFFHETYDAGGHIQAFSMQTNTASAKGDCLQIAVLLNSDPWKLWSNPMNISYAYGQQALSSRPYYRKLYQDLDMYIATSVGSH